MAGEDRQIIRHFLGSDVLPTPTSPGTVYLLAPSLAGVGKVVVTRLSVMPQASYDVPFKKHKTTLYIIDAAISPGSAGARTAHRWPLPTATALAYYLGDIAVSPKGDVDP